MDLYQMFEKDDWEFEHNFPELNKKRIDFIHKYSIEQIPEITLDDYLIAKKGYGNKDSFCRTLRYKLKGFCSMGNAFPSVFGIYLRDGTELTLSKTFQNEYGDDYEAAFTGIKNEIVTLLREVKDNDFEIVNDCLLNNTFKYKLISMYYVEKVIPVVTTVALNAYCDHIGLVFNENEEMIYRNLALKRFMEMNPKTSEWSTVKMMRFMDWLWRHNLYLDKESTMDINTPRKPKIIKPDYNHRMVVVCSNCGYEFIKAPRCPECGQLQDYGD